ncbi:MAG TPA: biotin--[acetyl-CoA-carboxylase] ligase [Acidimicrobiales bacterium]|nr:biotin--[acetyl-CoA-carboxylase] ligase [Acidimicrobiales bacterium]
MTADALSFTSAPGPSGTRFGEVRHYSSIDSTNRLLLDEARLGAPEGLVARAEHQSAGRGRMGRRWEAPPGANLLVSVLLRPEVPLRAMHLVTVALAMATADVCKSKSGLDPSLKWPNDLIVGDRKLAGLLAESDPGTDKPGGHGHGGRAVVVGVGLNVNWPAPEGEADRSPMNDDPRPGLELSGLDPPSGVDPPSGLDLSGLDSGDLRTTATSIWRESGRRLDPGELLNPLLTLAEPLLVDLQSEKGRERLAEEYRKRCSTLGRQVQVTLPRETFEATAVDLTPDGHLVVDLGTGRREVAAGDVVHIRTES